MKELAFANDVLKPWDDLNRLLVERYAFDPSQSDVTRAAKSLAIAIRHQVDTLSAELGGDSPRKLQSAVNRECLAAAVLCDIADMAKHGSLTRKERTNRMSVGAMFEFDERRRFRFIRNAILIEHEAWGELDFMAESLRAITFWMQKRNIRMNWRGQISEAAVDFFDTAWLRYNSSYCISMSATRLIFFTRDTTGSLRRASPPEVRFEIY